MSFRYLMQMIQGMKPKTIPEYVVFESFNGHVFTINGFALRPSDYPKRERTPKWKSLRK